MCIRDRVCTFTNTYTPPPANTCPVGQASNQWTDLLGIGMGSPKKHKVSAKLTIPNSTNQMCIRDRCPTASAAASSPSSSPP